MPASNITVDLVNTSSQLHVGGGTTIAEIAAMLGDKLPFRPICARVNNKTEGLDFAVYAPKTVEMLDITSDSGHRAYVRSLSMMLYGAVLMYVQLGTNGGGPISGLTEEYKTVVKGTINIGQAAIPYYVFYAAAAAVIMWLIWNKTALGKNMYAVGANPEAANVSGVSVTKTIVLVFTMAGILYGFSGFIEAARIGSNGAATGVNAELDAIAACVIGGVSFSGGTGKISGIITGVILLQIISVALQWLSVSSDLQYIIKGLIILVAVALDMRKYLAKK